MMGVYLHFFPVMEEIGGDRRGGLLFAGEVVEGSSNLNSVLLAEGNPRPSELRGLHHGTVGGRREAIVGDVAGELVRRVVYRQQRQHCVHGDHGRLELGVRRGEEHVHRR